MTAPRPTPDPDEGEHCMPLFLESVASLTASGRPWVTDRQTGMRHGPIRFPDGSPPLPHGCRWCGRPAYQHGARDVISSAGPHGWVRPTPAQTIARMRARRAARAEARRLARVLTEFERGAGLVGPCKRRRRRRAPVPPPIPAPQVCDDMNHNSVGSEVFCQLDAGHEDDHDDDCGTTWEQED
jgi:hypothetical protein